MHMTADDCPARGTARENRILARQQPETVLHAIRSPQSNGISEGLVHILKRDYSRVSPLPDSHTG